MNLFKYNPKSIIGANKAAAKFPYDVESFNDSKSLILFAAIVDVHIAIHNFTDNALIVVKNTLDRYSKVVGINLDDDSDIAIKFWKRILTKDKDGNTCEPEDVISDVYSIYGDSDIFGYIESKLLLL